MHIATIIHKAINVGYLVYPEVVEERDYQDVELRVRRLFDSSKVRADKRDSVTGP